MKHLLTLAAFAALTAAAVATEITVCPNKPWKVAGNGEYTINFNGGKTWPSIDLKSQEIKPDKFYRLSFEAKASGAANTQTGITGMRGGKRSTDYTPWRTGADYAPFNLTSARTLWKIRKFSSTSIPVPPETSRSAISNWMKSRISATTFSRTAILKTETISDLIWRSLKNA